MKIKKFKNLLKMAGAVLCSLLLLTMAGCGGGENSSASSSQPSAPSSSAPSHAAAPSTSPESSPVPEAASSQPSSEALGEFESLFAQNPIDQEYQELLMSASSVNAINKACQTAIGRWETAISLSYAQALDLLSGEERDAVKSQQEEWENSLEGKKEEIQAKAGDSENGSVSASQKIVELYRDRAKALCETVYNLTGELPELNKAMESQAPMG